MICGKATIIASDAENTAGYAVTEDPRYVTSLWENKLLKYRPDLERSAWRGRIMTFMAGREAEILRFGSHRGGDGDDLEQIDLMMEEAEILEARLERWRIKTRGLLQRHWHKIEHVAQTLLERELLSAEEIDSLISEVSRLADREASERIRAARLRAYGEFLLTARRIG